MTATLLPLTTLTADSVTDIPSGTAIDQAHGMYIALTTTAIPANPNIDRMVLIVQSNSASDQVLTVKAGVGGGATPGPAFRSGLGDLAATIHAASGGGIVGPFDPSRYLQLDNTINLTFDAGSQGKIIALMLPRSW